MELIIAAVVGGIFLAIVLWKVIFVIVGQAVDTLIRWAIYNFGNDEAVRRLEEEEKKR